DGAPNLFNVEQFFQDTITTLGANVFNVKVLEYFSRAAMYTKVLGEGAQPEVVTTKRLDTYYLSAGDDDLRLRASTMEAVEKLKDTEALRRGDSADQAMHEVLEEAVKAHRPALEDDMQLMRVVLKEDVEAKVAEHMKYIKAKAPNTPQSKLDAFANTLRDVYEAFRFAAERAGF